MSQPSFASRVWYRSVCAFFWVLLKVLLRLRYRGVENVPLEGPVILLANHQSHLDPIVVGVLGPRRLRFLARKSLFFWPLGVYLRSVGTIPLEGSGMAGLRAALRLLREGEAVVLFPEGTRSADGKLQRLKPGFCALARKTRATLVPIGIAGTFEAYSRHRRIPRPGRVAVYFGRPVPPDEFQGLEDGQLLELMSEQIRDCTREASQDIQKSRKKWLDRKA